MKTFVKVITIVMAVALVMTAAAVFTGCNSAKTDATTATVAATTATTATTAATEAAQNQSSGSQDQSGSSQQGGGTSSSDGHGIHDVYYANISEQDAGMKACDTVGAGTSIVTYYQGYYSDGSECWIVVVTDHIHNYTCYVNDSICVVVEDTDGHGIFDVYYADISEQQAGINACQAVGDGAVITSYYQGTYTDGSECWIVNVSNGETSYTCYVSGGYCIMVPSSEAQ